MSEEIKRLKRGEQAQTETEDPMTIGYIRTCWWVFIGHLLNLLAIVLTPLLMGQVDLRQVVFAGLVVVIDVAGVFGIFVVRPVGGFLIGFCTWALALVLLTWGVFYG